jgi:protein-S-isoprenylcysteine O-methyltransferase Ste14
MKDETRRGLIRWAVKSMVYLLVTGAIYFLSAGDWAWPGGWWFVTLNGANTLLTGALLVTRRPVLAARRSAMRSGTQAWDKVLAPAMAYGSFLIGLIAAWVFRFTGGFSVPLWLRLGAFALALAGSLISIWSMLANPYFEGTVRIQKEVNHRVARGGPYRWVRHPGYLGYLLFNLASPLVLGAWWAYAGVILSLGVVLVRTAKEDRFLRENLPGYGDYAQQTPWRLLPGIW